MTHDPALQPIATGLFVNDDPHPDRARLRGGRHRETGKFVFPFPGGDRQQDYADVALAPVGILWSFTVQRFRPKSPPYAGPEGFEPYAVGYVELPGQVIVESRLTRIPFDTLAVGMHLRLTIEPLVLADGPRAGFAFTCIEGRRS